MKTRLMREDGQASSEIAVFEQWEEAEQAAILLATANVFDYVLHRGRDCKKIRSYRRVLCPGCGADYTYSELSSRYSFGDKLCDCGQRFYILNLFYNGETAERYID